MTQICTKCAGSGLIGADKERPHLHVGDLSRCPDCLGTGKVGDAIAPAEPITEPIVEVAEQTEETPTVASEATEPNVTESVSEDSEPVL